MRFKPRDSRKRIGLIAGSGPEAGADLWMKVIEESKSLLGDAYEGDLDGPNVRIVSSPTLGLSMELEANDAVVRPEILSVYQELAQRTDYVAIACNTLNHYAPDIAQTGQAAQLISVEQVVRAYLQANGHSRAALLGAAPVTKMDHWSAYKGLRDGFEIEIPEDTAALHQIIYDVKRFGGDTADNRARFAALIDDLDCDIVLLACTELPLIPVTTTKKTLVDVTRLLARALVQKAYCEDCA